jgi:hypothetical protein
MVIGTGNPTINNNGTENKLKPNATVPCIIPALNITKAATTS